MAFNTVEKQILLEVKGIGLTVIKRFEEIGIDSLEKLAKCEAKEIMETVASMLNSSCWKNSPQALNAIEAAIQCARKNRDK